jgi:hypothetical protein
VDVGADRDVIEVGRADGRFHKTSVAVRGVSIQLRDMQVIFVDDSVFDPVSATRSPRNGSSSHPQDQLGNGAVRVITDRRSTARRLRMEAYLPDRRRGERRRYDIDPLLLTQGWAGVTSPES